MELVKTQTYNNEVVEKMIQDAEVRSYTQDLRVVNKIEVNDHLGYSIVEGLTDTYTVSHMVKGDTIFVYECTCPHNTHRGLPCKHMFKAGRQLDLTDKYVQLVSVFMEKGQKEKVISGDTIGLVDLNGELQYPSFSLDSLANTLKNYENATLDKGVIYTHRFNTTIQDVEDDTNDTENEVESTIMGTNINIDNDTTNKENDNDNDNNENIDTVTLIIKGTKIKISGKNLTVDVE